jgi:Zn-dependent protease with chaperone function
LNKVAYILTFLIFLGLPFLRAQPSPATPTAPPNSLPSDAAAPTKITAYTLPPDLYRKARNRGRISFVARVFGLFYGVWILWFLLQRKTAAKYRDWAERATGKRFVQAFIFAPLLLFTIALLQLPLDIFREAVLRSYGISVQTWTSWAADWAKSQLLTVLAGGLLAWILYAMIRRSLRRWWFYSWIIALPLIVFVVFISPYVVEPIFYEFAPLSAKAPELIPAIQRVMHKAGQDIPPERMLWMKASTKTIATNAYVSGFGPSKRVVIWDTTLAQETPDEILMDFGHELGHYVLKHILKGMIFMVAMLLALLYLGYRTIGWLLAKRGAAWGIRELDDWASLPALLLLLTIFGFVADTAGNAFSRYLENQADVFSLEINHGIVADPGQAMARGFQKFGETVFEDPAPNPVRVFLFYDHPPVVDRIHLFVTYDPWSRGEAPQFVK